MSKFLIWVNTFNRCQMLSNLIEDVHRDSHKHEVDLMVINDASGEDYTSIERHIKIYLKTKIHHGKNLYWKLINFAMSRIKILRGSYDYFIKTDDDMRLVPGFFDIIEKMWINLPNNKKATLDILSAPKQRGKTLRGNSAMILQNSYKYYRTQWVDMNFVFDPDFFPRRIGPCKASERSSGVGLWLTRYLNRMNCNLYQTSYSLLLHGNHFSQMNTEERKLHPLITKVEI